MNDIAKLVLTGKDLARLRVGDIRQVGTSDGTPVLLVLDTSPSRDHITWMVRVVLTASELDLIETDPEAGQIVTVVGQPQRLFQVVGEPS